MKKSLIVLCSIILALTLLISCSSSPKEEGAGESQGLYELFMDKMIYGALLCSDFEEVGEKTLTGLETDGLPNCVEMLEGLYACNSIEVGVRCTSGKVSYMKNNTTYSATVVEDVVMEVELDGDLYKTYTIPAETAITYEELEEEVYSQTVVSEGKTYSFVLNDGDVESMTMDGIELDDLVFNSSLSKKITCCIIFLEDF